MPANAQPLAPLPPPAHGARTALILLLTINLFNYLDRYILSSNLGAIEKELLPEGGESNKAWLGALTSAFMVAYMVFAPVFGWLADRMSRWLLVAIGVAVWSLASGASGLACAAVFGSFTLLLVTRCFVGIGEAAYGPSAPAILSDLYPVERRGVIMSWFYAAIPVGGAIGYMVGGMLGWPWAFYWVVPPGLVLAVLCFWMAEPRRGQMDRLSHHDPAAPSRPVAIKDYWLLAKVPSFVLGTLGYTAATFAVGGISAWLPYYIHDFRGEGTKESVAFMSGAIIAAAGLSATLLGGWAGDLLRPRFSGAYFLVCGLGMLVGFPLFLATLYAPFPFAWVLVFLSCFCVFFNTGPVNTIFANVTHPSLRAPGFAIVIFVIHAFGDAISPFVIGAVADSFPITREDGTRIADMNAGFLVISAMILIAGAIWMAGIPFLARDTANAPRQLDAAPPPG